MFIYTNKLLIEFEFIIWIDLSPAAAGLTGWIKPLLSSCCALTQRRALILLHRKEQNHLITGYYFNHMEGLSALWQHTG